MLKWKLRNLPNAQDVAELVAQKVITPEEAREILFTTGAKLENDQEVAALKDQIKFLEGLVQTLASRTNIHWNYTYPVTSYRPYWKTVGSPIYSGINQSGSTYTMSNTTMASALSKAT